MDVTELNELTAAIRAGMTEEITKHAKTVQAALAKSQADLETYGAVQEATKAEIARLGESASGVEARMTAMEQEFVEKMKRVSGVFQSLGTRFTEDETIKSFAAGGRVPRGRTAGMEIDLRDITSGAASAGPGIWSFRDPEVVADPYRPRMMRDLIPTVPVESNLIEYVRLKTRTNNAAAVSETGLKPKSDLVWERKETPVRKIAHFMKTSAEALSDMPRLRGEIDSEGLEMLKQEEEDQLLLGDGTGINLLGFAPQATAFSIASVVSGDTSVDVLRRALLQVTQSFFPATGIVMHPADWAAIELLKDTQDRYLFSSVTTGAPQRLWGLPVVQSFAIPTGQFLVGAFALAATIYDRMVATIAISTENEDDFVKNMVTVLFEERIALAVKRPLAFVRGNLDGTSL